MKRSAALLAVFVFLLSAAAAFAGEWTGQVVSKDGKLWFKSGANTYSIANPMKAAALAGQNVKVTGNVDQATKAVTIKEIAKV